MYYDKGKGAVIISDSRLQIGTDYYTLQKIFEIHEGIVFSSSGYSGIRDELIENFRSGMKQSRKTKTEELSPADIVRYIGQLQNELYYRYKMGERPLFPSDDTILEAITGYIHEGKPKLCLLFESGFVEMIRDPPFRAIGDGSRHANSILKRLYNSRLSKERAIEIGIHAIIQTSKIDAVVDDNPQIATIEPNGCRLWNIEKSGDFNVSTEEILKIKRKINGVGEKQDVLFNLLLDGSEDIIKKFNELIAEYEKAYQLQKNSI
jgi:20S proteasome alpha/beta subunit